METYGRGVWRGQETGHNTHLETGHNTHPVVAGLLTAPQVVGETWRVCRGTQQMSKTKNYRSDAMAAIHETMDALHRAGAVDKRTMRHFDEACLTPVQSLTARQIKGIREREHVSQTVFANYLNVTPSLVSQWERGEKRPSGPALKLLTLVEKHGLTAVA